MKVSFYTIGQLKKEIEYSEDENKVFFRLGLTGGILIATGSGFISDEVSGESYVEFLLTPLEHLKDPEKKEKKNSKKRVRKGL